MKILKIEPNTQTEYAGKDKSYAVTLEKIENHDAVTSIFYL